MTIRTGRPVHFYESFRKIHCFQTVRNIKTILDLGSVRLNETLPFTISSKTGLPNTS